MNKKKGIIVLFLLALLQLSFFVGILAYEEIMVNAILEKGESYSLDFTSGSTITRKGIYPDTENLYTVGYDWDYKTFPFDDFIPRDSVGVFPQVRIKKNEDGTVSFFSTDENKELLTDYNWFITYRSFWIGFDDYEFVIDGFGEREIFELAKYGDELFDESVTYEDFVSGKSDYSNYILQLPLSGRITLKVYKGYAKISEVYVDDMLIAVHK